MRRELKLNKKTPIGALQYVIDEAQKTMRYSTEPALTRPQQFAKEEREFSPERPTSPEEQGAYYADLVECLRKRAEIRRQIPTRKSVQLSEPDRIADLLEEAATAIEKLHSGEGG